MEEIRKRKVFLDGGMGSLLQERGLPAGQLPETWNLQRPEVVRQIHLEYLQAGCDIVTANTFGANGLKFPADGDMPLEQVVDTYHPDRILIEPSGVGKLSDVITAVTRLNLPDVVLNSFTTVADAGKCRIYAKNFGEFYNDQVEHAACIILSRTGNMPEEKLNAAVKLMQQKNPNATIIATPWDQLSGRQILDAMEHRDCLADILLELSDRDEAGEHAHHHHDHEHEHHHDHEHEHHHEHEHEHHHHDHEEGCSCGCHEHGHHHADEVFSSWGRETAGTYTAEQLRAALEELDTGKYGSVLRAKGMVSAGDGWLFFDYVPGEQNIRPGTAQVIGRLCVIGSGLQEEKLEALFGLEG